MQTITTSYDEKFDILYARYSGAAHSYGEEEPDGIVTFRSIANDTITGEAIYNFQEKMTNGVLNLAELPIPLSFGSRRINERSSNRVCK